MWKVSEIKLNAYLTAIRLNGPDGPGPNIAPRMNPFGPRDQTNGPSGAPMGLGPTVPILAERLQE